LGAPGAEEKRFGKHPTQKPVALVERCLLAATSAGDLVLDPFGGSATTAVACLRTGRRVVVIEAEAAHCLLACARVRAEAAQPADLFLPPGRPRSPVHE
jgi:site-specific DNA-methyltransferase (adenine-specific)